MGNIILGRAQVRCTHIGRGRVKEIHTSFENINRRHLITTKLWAQIVTEEVIRCFCSEVRSLCVDRSSSSDVLSGLKGEGDSQVEHDIPGAEEGLRDAVTQVQLAHTVAL